MHKLSYITFTFTGLVFASVLAGESDTEQLTRKKHASLAIVLHGLAQSCSQVSDVLTADNQQARQQGVLNVISTVLATVAQLTEPHTATTKGSELDTTSVNLATLSTVLFEEADQEQRTALVNTSPLLAQLMTLQPQEREDFTRKLFSSSFKRSKFVNELFTFLTSYLIKNLPKITEHIKEHLLRQLDTAV
jgi:hypothetical protein